MLLLQSQLSRKVHFHLLCMYFSVVCKVILSNNSYVKILDGIARSCPNCPIFSISFGYLISLNIAIIVVESNIFKGYPSKGICLSFIFLIT